MTFFTPEDAVSVKEMVDHLPFGDENFAPDTPRPPARGRTESRDSDIESSEAVVLSF